ncbi:MAG: c-type cytochrome biosis protein CcmI [Proteobacteria bacterium]|nr:c-type cytochrome biosis protein CcmI [Pseudomonadota bacterium]
MSAFLIAILILLLFVVTLVLRPLWRTTPVVALAEAEESPALRILREQRIDLDAQLAAGLIDASTHAESMDELTRRVLAESAPVAPLHSTAARRGWAIAIGLCVPLLTVLLYAGLGNPAGLDPARRNAPAQISSAQINAMVENLAAKVAANPDDLEGLHMLGRSYMMLERFKEADATYAKLAARQTGNAQVLADWADAKASAAGGKLAGEPAGLVEQALKIDPENVKALALAGTVAFDQADYRKAVSLWEKMAARVDPKSDMGQSAQAMIAEARTRAGMPAKAQSASSAAPSATLTLRGRIRIARTLKTPLDPASTLFVFARPAAGGPPIAALRFKAADLPLEIDFSQATLMTQASALPEKVIIGARISKSGKPTPSPGDLQGFSSPVSPDTRDFQLEINEEVGQPDGK